jgi:hypothetical protein
VALIVASSFSIPVYVPKAGRIEVHDIPYDLSFSSQNISWRLPALSLYGTENSYWTATACDGNGVTMFLDLVEERAALGLELRCGDDVSLGHVSRVAGTCSSDHLEGTGV